MTGEIYLILGPMTSGKSTLARAMVENGLSDVYIENDEFWIYTTGLEVRKLWEGQNEPSSDQFRKKNNYAGKTVSALAALGSVTVSGVWPGSEFQDITRYVRDYKAVILWVGPDTAQEIWQKRTPELDWKDGPWSSADWWNSIQTDLTRLAVKLEERGRLITDGAIVDLAKQKLDWSGIINGTGDILPFAEGPMEDTSGKEGELTEPVQKADVPDIDLETEESDDG
jgi:energy-coupling factor transporter ATP-binding protein EcfA2